MKKIILVIMSLLLLAGPSYAATTNAKTGTSVTIESVFAVEFFDEDVRYATGQITFPGIDPADEETMVMTSAWQQGDNLSDVGVLVLTNANADWDLTLTVENIGSATLIPENVAAYLPDVVYIRNEEVTATTGLAKDWAVIPDTGQLIYSGSGGYQNTTPFGVLATFSFAILPTGQADIDGDGSIDISGGHVLGTGTHTFDIVYTLSNALP